MQQRWSAIFFWSGQVQYLKYFYSDGLSKSDGGPKITLISVLSGIGGLIVFALVVLSIAGWCWKFGSNSGAGTWSGVKVGSVPEWKGPNITTGVRLEGSIGMGNLTQVYETKIT